MNLRIITTTAVLLTCGMATAASTADDASQPVILKYTPSDEGIILTMSRNGQWALCGSAYSDVECASVLLEVQTGQQYDVDPGARGFTPSAVSDDGSILAGSIGQQAAWLDRTTATYHLLPHDANWTSASISAMTADGHYAVGTLTGYVGPDTGATATYFGAAWCMTAALWDLTTDQQTEMPNLPTLDMTHENQWQLRATDITADGRYVALSQSFSYLEPAALCCYIYDRETATWRAVGFDPDDVSAWTPWNADLHYIDGLLFSPNGQWATGEAYMGTESQCFRYNVQTGAFDIYQDDDNPMPGYAIDDEGVVYASSPSGTPLREMYVRYGCFWIGLDEILRQRYGMDFCTQTAYERTGTVFSVSGDGKVIHNMVDPTGESYIITLPEPLSTSCLSLDLLGTYSVTPATDCEIAQMRGVSITFTRNVTLTAEAASNAAQLVDVTTGTTLRNSLSFAIDDDNKTLQIGFRTTTLTDGDEYEVRIPAGMLSVVGAETAVNRALALRYVGRANQPLAVQQVSPAAHSSFSKIDYDSNPIIFTFDAQTALTDSASAALYRTDQQNAICSLSLACSGNRVAVYPASAQYLYEGLTYQVVLAAGSVTDVAGGCANEADTVTYHGNYVREVSSTERYLFSDDFASMSTSLNNYLLYEGDHRTPTSTMEGWGFDADNTPWNFSIRETSSSTDYCACSHSMYAQAGRSDDWMVIPQLYIPDDKCTLNFDAQSYYASKADTLTILVWEADASYSALTDAIVEQMRQDGRIIMSERLTNGGSNENLSGEWQHYQLSLAAYAGRNIYIALINNNDDQSAIFVDNLTVERNVMYAISLLNAEAVVAQTSQQIAGRLTIEGEETYDGVTLTLQTGDGTTSDADTQVLGTITRSDIQLTKGDTIDFCFDQPLPLTVGEENPFSIRVRMGDVDQTTTSSVKDLAFSPVKRVVLEEMTGVTCVYCPQGIIAIEHMKELAGDRFIPLCIHTYTGDPYASGQEGYQSFLGLNAAPTGRLQRRAEVSLPMYVDDDGQYQLSNPEKQNLWMDVMQQELATETTHDVSAVANADTEAGTLTVDVSVSAALNSDDILLNVFMVVLEDSIVSYQANTLFGVNQDILGEWSNGGRYASAYAMPFCHNDVVRACWGSTYNGTSGLLPQQMTAGEAYTTQVQTTLPGTVTTLGNCRVVIMLIDANTDLVVNAAEAPVRVTTSGIEDVAAEAAEDVDYYTLLGTKASQQTGSRQILIKHTSHNSQKIIIR